MINKAHKFGKYADIVEAGFDGRTKVGKPVKKTAKVIYFIYQAGAVVLWSALICYGIFS